MRRMAPTLAGIAGAGLVLGVVTPVGPLALLFIVAVFGGLGALALLALRRSALPEPGWAGPGRRLDLGPAAVRTGPGPRVRPPARRVAFALARVEARELVSSPWFGVGLGLLLVVYLSLAVVWGADNGEHWSDVVGLAPWMAHPVVGTMVLAAHRGITRARRDGADELFDTCPAAVATRTWGSICSAWVPVPALVAFFAVYAGTVAVRSPNLYGSPGFEAVAQVLSALVLGVGGVVLGVALGRWVRFALAPIVAVVAIGFFSLKLATVGDPGWNPLQQLSTFPPLSSQPPAFVDAVDRSHLAWLLALTGGVLVIAVAFHRRDRTVVLLGAAAALLAGGTGVAATRPMSGPSAARIASRIAAPAAHQACRPAGPIQVCVYAGSQELAGRIAAEVTPAATMLPAAALPFTLRQSFPGTIEDLPPEVARRLPGGVPPVPGNEASPGFDASPGSMRASRFVVATRVVGLPLEPDADDRPLVIAGQARGVVALWLASRGLGPSATRDLLSGRTAGDLGDRQPDAFDLGYAWPGCTSPVVWSAQDLRAARALVALPDAAVRAAVHQGWERWRDPTTGTDQLMAAVGLPALGPFDAFQTRAESPNC